MDRVNRKLIDEFGSRNANMADDAPNVHCDPRTGRLWSHLELRALRKKVLPRIPPDRRGKLGVLDVGAGKGRMTGELAKIAARLVAIEPFPPFYESLRTRFAPRGVEVAPRTLGEYAQVASERFDLIYASGVVMYLSDDELGGFLRAARRLLRPEAFLVIREPTLTHAGLSEDGRPASGREATLAARHLFYRGRSELIEAVEAEGLRAVHDARAYPANVAAAVRQRWPNPLTAMMYRAATSTVAYPIWWLWGRMNLKPNGGLFWFYAFQNANGTTPQPRGG